MLPYILAAVGGYLIGDSLKGKQFADGGRISKGVKWKQEWTDTKGVEGYDILEIEDTKYFSNNYRGGIVVRSRIIESSKPQRVGEYQEDSKTELRKIFSGKYPFAYKFAEGGQMAIWGGVRGRLNEPMLSFSKVDYDVNVNPKNLEVDVNIKENDSVDYAALSDTGAEWEQYAWGYMVYPKNVDELYQVLKALRTNVSKERLQKYIKNENYADGGMMSKGGSPEYYIEFLNKKKNFSRDRKEFATYEEAVNWGRKNLGNFNSDMVSMIYSNGGGVEFKPYGKTKGIFKLEYKVDGENQSEIWESKEMVDDAAKRYSKIGYTDIKITELNKKMAKGGQVYNLGDKWSPSFDYTGMLETALKAQVSWGMDKLRKLYDSFEDVNYHTASRSLWEAIKSLKDNDVKAAERHLEHFRADVMEEMK